VVGVTYARTGNRRSDSADRGQLQRRHPPPRACRLEDAAQRRRIVGSLRGWRVNYESSHTASADAVNAPPALWAGLAGTSPAAQPPRPAPSRAVRRDAGHPQAHRETSIRCATLRATRDRGPLTSSNLSLPASADPGPSAAIIEEVAAWGESIGMPSWLPGSFTGPDSIGISRCAATSRSVASISSGDVGPVGTLSCSKAIPCSADAGDAAMYLHRFAISRAAAGADVTRWSGACARRNVVSIPTSARFASPTHRASAGTTSARFTAVDRRVSKALDTASMRSLSRHIRDDHTIPAARDDSPPQNRTCRPKPCRTASVAGHHDSIGCRAGSRPRLQSDAAPRSSQWPRPTRRW